MPSPKRWNRKSSRYWRFGKVRTNRAISLISSGVSFTFGTTGTRMMSGLPVFASRLAFSKMTLFETPVTSWCFSGSRCLMSIITRSVTGSSVAKLFHRQLAAVSMAVCNPSDLHRSRIVREKSYCILGSPPESVTPPLETW